MPCPFSLATSHGNELLPLLGHQKGCFRCPGSGLYLQEAVPTLAARKHFGEIRFFPNVAGYLVSTGCRAHPSLNQPHSCAGCNRLDLSQHLGKCLRGILQSQPHAAFGIRQQAQVLSHHRHWTHSSVLAKTNRPLSRSKLICCAVTELQA